MNLFKFTKAGLHTVCVSSHTYTTLLFLLSAYNYLKKKYKRCLSKQEKCSINTKLN